MITDPCRWVLPRDFFGLVSSKYRFRDLFEVSSSALAFARGLENSGGEWSIDARFFFGAVRRSLLGGSSSSLVVGLNSSVSLTEERDESSWLDPLRELGEDVPVNVAGGRCTLFLGSNIGALFRSDEGGEVGAELAPVDVIGELVEGVDPVVRELVMSHLEVSGTRCHSFRLYGGVMTPWKFHGGMTPD